MDSKELFLKYFPAIKMHWLPLSLGALGMIFFAYGLIGLFLSNKTDSDDIVFEANPTSNDSTEAKTIFIDIEGAVVKPGLYKLPHDSRIQDSLIAAGGLSVLADREYIAKNLNLATKLTDGAKIYVPAIGEAVMGGAVLNSSSQININTGSQS